MPKVMGHCLICGMATISGIFVYPIKSLRGIELDSAAVTDRGLQYDRRWMLVDDSGRFLSQREHPRMALLHTRLEGDQLIVFPRNQPDQALPIPLDSEKLGEITSSGSSSGSGFGSGSGSGSAVKNRTIDVTVWDDTMPAFLMGPQYDQWFSDFLGFSARLVYQQNTTRRVVDSRYTSQEEITSFSDAYPVLLIGQASLDDLNSRLEQPVPMNRFRPNIVIKGWAPYQEDEIRYFQAGPIRFEAVKPCARCVLTTVDQDSAIRGKEPLKTLASYRTKNNKVIFGQNLIYSGKGRIEKGMEVRII
jgi:uncharacterized protein YcbX